MINLLPPQEKEALLLEKKCKLITILGIVLIIPLACLLLILLSIYFYLLAQTDSQKIVLAEARQQYQTPDFMRLTDAIKKDNLVMSGLASFYKSETYATHILKAIADISRPNNLYLTSLSLDKEENLAAKTPKKVKVSVAGFAGLREDLLLFQKNLLENKNITNLRFSPESWVDPQNITFYLTFEYEQKYEQK